VGLIFIVYSDDGNGVYQHTKNRYAYVYTLEYNILVEQQLLLLADIPVC
jgi:hypothetical protein